MANFNSLLEDVPLHFFYESAKGILTRRDGSKAGYLTPKGKIYIRHHTRLFTAQEIIFAYMRQLVPPGKSIFPVDRDWTNLKFDNLMVGSRADAIAHAHATKRELPRCITRNKCGNYVVTFVGWKQDFYLGAYHTIDEAIEVLDRAKQLQKENKFNYVEFWNEYKLSKRKKRIDKLLNKLLETPILLVNGDTYFEDYETFHIPIHPHMYTKNFIRRFRITEEEARYVWEKLKENAVKTDESIICTRRNNATSQE